MYLMVAKSLSPTWIRAPTSRSLTSTRFVMMLQQCEQRPTMLNSIPFSCLLVLCTRKLYALVFCFFRSRFRNVNAKLSRKPSTKLSNKMRLVRILSWRVVKIMTLIIWTWTDCHGLFDRNNENFVDILFKQSQNGCVVRRIFHICFLYWKRKNHFHISN